MLRRSTWTLLALSLAASSTLGCSSDAGQTTDETPTSPVPDAPTPEQPAPPAPGEEPIEAQAGAWSWVPVEGAACANGAPTGLGVNLGTSDRVLVYFEGGGACWNGLTCFTMKTATNMADGYTETEFTRDVGKAPSANTIFDRASAKNVFKDDSFVYVPYCTGDVHAGNNVADYEGKTVHHVGRKNVEAYVKRLVPTFKAKAKRVVVAGSSAGGFGAALNYGRFAEAFAPTRVDLLDDSGPPFPAAQTPYLAEWNASWDLFSGMPSGCAGCATDPAAAIPYYSATYPDARFALLSYDMDNVIQRFYGMNGEQFKAALGALATGSLDPLPNMRYFFVPGAQHTMLRKLDTSTAGKSLATWLTSMATDAGDWASAKP